LKQILKNDFPSDQVYQLKDLEAWPELGVSLAVLGNPIQHSLSPQMHNAAMAEMAQVDPEFNNWTYYKFQIHPDNLHQALDMFHSNGFLGLNLTVPHKVLATQWIKIGESAVKLSGASNTLIRGVDGYKGYNTDLYGLVKALESGFGINLQDQEVILLGAGGAARAAAIACAQAGVKSLTLINRTMSKLDTILESLDQLDEKPNTKTRGINEPVLALSHNPIVINATSLGLKKEDPAPIDLALLPHSTRVFDMIYNPDRTTLLKQAESLGMEVCNGLNMLAYQGERSLKIWTQKNPSSKTMFEAALNGLKQSQ
tara:strand:- start:1273 stop:2211 length:939 start_codon:yes stop_codon:yes gene_type:complete